VNNFARGAARAKLIAFLASEDAAYITGALVPIDGGYAAGKQAELMAKGETGNTA